MPRKSKRNKPKRNANGNGSSSQQSQQRTSQFKSQDKPEKELTETFLAFHKLSLHNNSRCSFLPPSSKQEQETSVQSQHSKSIKSNSNRISSPRRNRSTGMTSSRSGSSKHHSTGGITTQTLHKHESTRKHVDTAAKKEKTEKSKKKSEMKTQKIEKTAKIDKKSNTSEKKEKSIINLKDVVEKKEKKKEKGKEKTMNAERPSPPTIGPILGWEQVKANGNRGIKPSNSKLISNATRGKDKNQESLPLANNRFYELSTKAPDTEESPIHRANQGAIPKRKIASHDTAAQAKDESLRNILAVDTQMSQKKYQSQKPTDLFGTYLNVDGTRSQITNWRRNIDLGPIWEPSSVYMPWRIVPKSRPIASLPQAPPKRNDTYSNDYNSTSYKNACNHSNSAYNNYSTANVSGKIAPLRNLYEPGRDIWVNRPEYNSSNSQRCVKILPSHHQCAGTERLLTPNDVDVEDIACKLEQHERISKPGTKSSPCICFRASRRAFCMNCKTHVIGRPFRKCHKHPDIGFSTDHYYCPFCLTDALELKEL